MKDAARFPGRSLATGLGLLRRDHLPQPRQPHLLAIGKDRDVAGGELSPFVRDVYQAPFGHSPAP